MDYSRPRIKLVLTEFDRLLERFALLEVLFLWGYAIVSYKSLSKTIPSHFSFSGQIDGYGDRLFIFILPIVAVVIYTGFTILNNYPHLFNYTARVTEGNAEKLYTLSTRLIRWLKCIIALLFIFLTIQIVESAKHGRSGFVWWDIVLIILLINIPVFIYLYKSGNVKTEK